MKVLISEKQNETAICIFLTHNLGLIVIFKSAVMMYGRILIEMTLLHLMHFKKHDIE
jgi:hypothetical protein